MSTIIPLPRVPEREGFYYWRESNNDPWRHVKMWWAGDFENGAQGESIMVLKFMDSGEVVKLRDHPIGQWATYKMTCIEYYKQINPLASYNGLTNNVYDIVNKFAKEHAICLSGTRGFFHHKYIDFYDMLYVLVDDHHEHYQFMIDGDLDSNNVLVIKQIVYDLYNMCQRD